MSLLVFTEKYLLNNGWVRNIYCGLTSLWAWCKVCESYASHYPLQFKGIVGNERYVCQQCKSHSTLVG